MINSVQTNQSYLIMLVPHNQLPCILSMGRTLEYLLWLCMTRSWLRPQPLLCMCCSDQRIPMVLFFCSVTHWSVAPHSHTHSSTCFPSPTPRPSTSSFDLVYILLFSPLRWPSSCLRRRQTSLTSSPCSSPPLLQAFFSFFCTPPFFAMFQTHLFTSLCLSPSILS